MVGKTLGHYEILELLGVGGMGEVYRAHDPRLNRDLAMKVLPPDLATDAERLARLQREAQLLATLSHPHVAAVYGFEQIDGTSLLAMELVEGRGLDEILRTGPLAIDEALELARQIAEGVEAAHEKGIIHRDLKPANIRVTPGGMAKVLDFGLAKGDSEGSRSGSSGELSASPTIAAPTVAGVILGTALYMSPEQARGRPLDRRTDVWSFGCVLYEMLTGARLFSGETITDILAAIVREDPDWTALPEATPAAVRRLLERCLRKDPRKRQRDLGDASLDLAELADVSGAEQAVAGPAPTSPWRRLAAAALLVATGVVLGAVTVRSFLPASEDVPAAKPTHFSLILPMELEDSSIPPGLAISPDGRKIALSAATAGAGRVIYLHDFETGKGGSVPGTERGVAPFFSPDGAEIGFFDEAADRVMRVPLSGGQPVHVVTTEDYYRNPVWEADRIYFPVRYDSPISQVDIDGNNLQLLTELDVDSGERHQAPSDVLPGGHLLYTSYRGVAAERPMVVLLPAGGGTPIDLTAGSTARYVSSGHLVFQRAATLYAAPFDIQRLELTGSPVALIGGLYDDDRGNPGFAVSETGTLAYRPIDTGAVEDHTLTWFGIDGTETVALNSPDHLSGPKLSPDGKKVAVTARAGSTYEILIGDLDRGTWVSFATEGSSAYPTWSADGSRIAYSSDHNGAINIYVRSLDGSSTRQVTHTEDASLLSDWSRDGRSIAYSEDHSVWVLDLEEGSEPRRIAGPEGEPWGGMLSPDGSWIAYVSIVTGDDAVYARPTRAPGPELLVSLGEAAQPHWAADGSALYYLRTQGLVLMRADVTWNGAPSFSVPEPVMTLPAEERGTVEYFTNYAMSGSSDSVLAIVGRHPTPADHVNVVLNWFEELKQQVPTER